MIFINDIIEATVVGVISLIPGLLAVSLIFIFIGSLLFNKEV